VSLDAQGTEGFNFGGGIKGPHLDLMRWRNGDNNNNDDDDNDDVNEERENCIFGVLNARI
jgi:hypothetical protein